MINISEKFEKFVEGLRAELTNEIMSTLEDEKYSFLRMALRTTTDENILKTLKQEKYSLSGFSKNGDPPDTLSFEFSLGTVVKEESHIFDEDEVGTEREVKECLNGYEMRQNEYNLLNALGVITFPYPTTSPLYATIRYYPDLDKGFLEIKNPILLGLPKSTEFLRNSLKEEAVAALKRKKEELKKQKERLKQVE